MTEVIRLNYPYISRVRIKNYRNFKAVDVSLSQKQLLIGENNVGKTNFLRAIQLILDPRLSESDRYLTETDFHDGLDSPMEKGEEIEVSIEVRGYQDSNLLLSEFSDATVARKPLTLRFTYRYSPVYDDDKKIKKYEYKIFQGINEDIDFRHSHRQILNLRVISALRDVEVELKSYKRSPLLNVIKQYEIRKEDLAEIADNLQEASDELLNLDELVDTQKHINKGFSKLVGLQPDSELSLATIDVDLRKLLNTLKIVIGSKKRSISDSSLGLNNILYISLVLLELEDSTVPTFIRSDRFKELLEIEDSPILMQCYELNNHQNYVLKNSLSLAQRRLLYKYMDKTNQKYRGFSILALEEPEAHLHPTLQRLIYKDVIEKSNMSVLLTTHSTHIASVAPIDSIAYLRRNNDNETLINSSAKIKLKSDEKMDLERYVDANRGEVYFGKGVILVEGIAEEYLMPRFAELLNTPLEEHGIVICNINSTNFKPYVKLLKTLEIPFVLFTDGDYYKIYEDKDKKQKREYHLIVDENAEKSGFLGHEILRSLLVDLGLKKEIEFTGLTAFDEEKIFNNYSFHVGQYTLEVDIMNSCAKEKSKLIICEVFNELTEGGEQQKENFKKELLDGEYWKCLSKIEANGIGKGRFAQKFASRCKKDHIPGYIEKGLEEITRKVARADEI